MSYNISYRREVRWVPHPDPFYGRLYFFLEESGDNNVTESTGRSPAHERRARDWSCLYAGEEHACFEAVTLRAAACCGGSLKFSGTHRYATPEGYIRSWRLALKAALPLLKQPPIEPGRPYREDNEQDMKDWSDHHRWQKLWFTVTPFTKIWDHERDDRGVQYRLGLLEKQTLVPPTRDKCQYSDREFTLWTWDVRNPEHLRLWLSTRSSQRHGWDFCDVTGPRR